MGHIHDAIDYAQKLRPSELKRAWNDKNWKDLILPPFGLLVAIGGTLGILVGIYFGIYAIWSFFRPSPPPPSPPPTTRYRVALIGPFTGSENQTWSVIIRGIKEADSAGVLDSLKARGPGLEFIDYDDEGNKTLTQQKAKEICDDSSVVMAMGFVETSVAQRALPIFQRCNLPTVLIATTSTDLTSNNMNQWSQPILRLAPSNYQQAVQIVAGLGDTFGTAPCRLLVLKDGDNKGYSDNLESELSKAITEAKKTKCQPEVLVYDPDSIEKILFQALSRRPKVEAIVFFGMTLKGAEFLKIAQRVRTRLGLRMNQPPIIVSDGSTNQQLIEAAGSASECVWGTFPFGEPRNFSSSVNPSTKPELANPSFYAYGYDAVVVMAHALSKGSPISRESVGKQFQILAEQKQFLDGMAGVYEFGKDGGLHSFWDKERRIQLDQFHLWQVRKYRDKLIWKHREWRDSLSVGCVNK